MPDDLTPTRRFTDGEIRLILKAATEDQHEVERATELSENMSLAELEQVAVQAGIDPASVRRAALSIDASTTPAEHSAFMGSPTTLVFERVTGRTIDPAKFDEIVDAARGLTREIGELNTVGRQFGWKCHFDGAPTEVSVFAGEQRTTVRVKIYLNGVPLAVFMGKLILGALGTLTLASGNTAVTGVAGLLVGAASYLWARRGLRRAAARYSARGRELIDAVVNRIAPPGA